jgi:hypothetical protein
VQDAILEYYRHEPREKMAWRRMAAIGVILSQKLKEEAYLPPEVLWAIGERLDEGLPLVSWQRVAHRALGFARVSWGWRW